ncbi:uncharacterized protein LOC132707029 isoform X2 [Cylas formicarius]|uniref:uncharacterized protein LOC132707029 isoform X2 n=1 Tax=Cylas formicarius TaxID=197179 RepID=UPI0029583E1D|nr:uncharacterized protein LOC132707029 isoform X2 [Cylas formicarius]
MAVDDPRTKRDDEDRLARGREVVHLPVITVDQLSSHRKKKSDGAAALDNLRVLSGSFRHLKSEYTRRFKRLELPEVGQRSRGPELDDPSKETVERSAPSDSPQIIQSDVPPNVTSAIRLYRPKLSRRSTNLKLTGERYFLTSYAEDFIRYLIKERAELQRRATTLKLFGDMEHGTESRRNFVPYTNVYRPPLCKKVTNLHLSGSLLLDTENRDQFLPFKIERRGALTKTPTNLRMEGTIFLEPEYKSAFIEYKNYEKSRPAAPTDHLKSPADLSPEERDVTGTKLHPVIPFLRSASPRLQESRTPSRPSSRCRRNSTEAEPRVASVPRSPMRPKPRPNETPTIKINDEEARVVRRNQRIKYTKKLEPNMAHGLPPPPLCRPQELKLPAVKWKSSPKVEIAAPDPERFEGRFECQPEYRRAYINYLTRERLENKTPLFQRDPLQRVARQ